MFLFCLFWSFGSRVGGSVAVDSLAGCCCGYILCLKGLCHKVPNSPSLWWGGPLINPMLTLYKKLSTPGEMQKLHEEEGGFD